MIFNTVCGKPPFQYRYDGESEFSGDANTNWILILKTSGTLKIDVIADAIDICCVGGGGGGGGASHYHYVDPYEDKHWGYGGGGGGGGYVVTESGIVIPEASYTITVGDGGKGGKSYDASEKVGNGEPGGTSAFGTYCTANGGSGGGPGGTSAGTGGAGQGAGGNGGAYHSNSEFPTISPTNGGDGAPIFGDTTFSTNAGAGAGGGYGANGWYAASYGATGQWYGCGGKGDHSLGIVNSADNFAEGANVNHGRGQDGFSGCVIIRNHRG